MMLTLLRKEIWSNLGNWSTWIIVAAYTIMCVLFLFFFENGFNIFDIGSASLQSYFTLSPWLLLFILPALSMKTFAEEEQNGTLNWLFSQPITNWELVLGKFFSVFLVGILCIIPSLIYLYTIYILAIPEGNLDWGAIMGSYIGIILLIAAFSAIGIFASSISSNQVSAYLIGGFLCFFLYNGLQQIANYKLLGGADYWLQNIGIYYHYNGFTRGLVDSRDLFYFLWVIVVILFGCTQIISMRKK